MRDAKKNIFLDENIDYEIDQVWAEAVAAWNSGENIWIGYEMEQMAKKIQEQHTEENPLVGAIEAYLDELAVTGYGLQVTEWKAALPHFVLLRTLQVLGAYGYRGYFERKQHFLESIPLALHNLRDILEPLQNEYPYLYALSNDLLLLV